MRRLTKQLTLIAIGGAPGTGKSTLAQRIALEWHLPLLSSDRIGAMIGASQGLREGNAIWIAHDLLFQLSAQFLDAGVSTILDLNLGWDFQWQQIDALRAVHSSASIMPLILRCDRALSMQRIQQRYKEDPRSNGHPSVYANEQAQNVWGFLEALERPDVIMLDAAQTTDTVYAQAISYLAL